MVNLAGAAGDAGAAGAAGAAAGFVPHPCRAVIVVTIENAARSKNPVVFFISLSFVLVGKSAG